MSHVTVNHYVNTTVVFYWTSAIVFCQINRQSHIHWYFYLRRTASMLHFKWEAFSHMMDQTDVRSELPLWLKRAMGSLDGKNSWENRVTVFTQWSARHSAVSEVLKAPWFNELSAYCSSSSELFCHSAICGDIQRNEMPCLTGTQCYACKNIWT